MKSLGIGCNAVRALLGVSVALVLAGCQQSLHDLVSRGDLVAAEALAAQNPSALESQDRLGKTPLFAAVAANQVHMLRWLLEAGAKVDARDNTGLTPLHTAALLGREDALRMLMKAGADTMARDQFGNTPLHSAAIHGRGQSVRVLAETTADFLAENNDGETAEDLALQYRHERAAAYIAHLAARRPRVNRSRGAG